MRKPSGKNVRYLGDPLLQPIRSYENATLVRTLYRLSSFLNEKVRLVVHNRPVFMSVLFFVSLYMQYSEQLAAVGSGNGLLHALLRQLLSPPPPNTYTTLFPHYR